MTTPHPLASMAQIFVRPSSTVRHRRRTSDSTPELRRIRRFVAHTLDPAAYDPVTAALPTPATRLPRQRDAASQAGARTGAVVADGPDALARAAVARRASATR